MWYRVPPAGRGWSSVFSESSGSPVSRREAGRRSLLEQFAAVEQAMGEREGIGVDRMTADMLSLGHPPPVFSEVDGPYVRVALIGGEPDREWLGFINRLGRSYRSNLDLLLILHRLIDRGWADPDSAAPVLQRPAAETRSTLRRLADDAQINDSPIMESVRGSPDGHPPAFRLSDDARRHFPRKLERLATRTGRESVILDFATARGRVSSTEAADLTGVTASHAAQVLAALADAGHLVGSRPNRRGRGYHYIAARAP